MILNLPCFVWTVLRSITVLTHKPFFPVQQISGLPLDQQPVVLVLLEVLASLEVLLCLALGMNGIRLMIESASNVLLESHVQIEIQQLTVQLDSSQMWEIFIVEIARLVITVRIH